MSKTLKKTPILSAKQQKGTLSAKKTKTKETIRNVLAIPYVKYWPLVAQGNDYEAFISALRVFLELVTPCVPLRIPWKELRKVPKTERKLLKMPLKYAGIVDKKMQEKKNLILGVNDINRALQNHPETIKGILISSDVQPRLMVEHLIDQSILHQISILVIPDLRKILKETYGLSSIALALVNDCSDVLMGKMKEIHKQFPVPENHINFKRALFLTNPGDKDSIRDNNNSALNLKHMEKLHLIRNSSAHRCFIPKKQNSQMGSISMDFVPFSMSDKALTTHLSDEEDEVIVIPDTPIKSDSFVPSFYKKAYNSLSVKKVKGNKNRNKRKVDDMENKVKKKRFN